jgi:hypothetical protein
MCPCTGTRNRRRPAGDAPRCSQSSFKVGHEVICTVQFQWTSQQVAFSVGKHALGGRQITARGCKCECDCELAAAAELTLHMHMSGARAGWGRCHAPNWTHTTTCTPSIIRARTRLFGSAWFHVPEKCLSARKNLSARNARLLRDGACWWRGSVGSKNKSSDKCVRWSRASTWLEDGQETVL